MKKLENIFKILINSNMTPSYFGLGFIQCKISESERYHFYHEKLFPIIDIEEEVHDHRYDFKSKIIKGSLVNKKYKFIEMKEKNENIKYYKENESCNKNIIINEKNIEKGNLTFISLDQYNEGETYEMLHDEFHTVETNNCITYLKRGKYKKQFANVIRPIKEINKEKICPFSKKLTNEECWNIIKELLEIKK